MDAKDVVELVFTVLGSIAAIVGVMILFVMMIISITKSSKDD